MTDLRLLDRQLEAADLALADDLRRIADADGLSADARVVADMLAVSVRAIHQRQGLAISVMARTNV